VVARSGRIVSLVEDSLSTRALGADSELICATAYVDMISTSDILFRLLPSRETGNTFTNDGGQVEFQFDPAYLDSTFTASLTKGKNPGDWIDLNLIKVANSEYSFQGNNTGIPTTLHFSFCKSRGMKGVTYPFIIEQYNSKKEKSTYRFLIRT